MSARARALREPALRPTPRGQAEREAKGREAAQVQLILLRHGEPDWYPDGERAVDDAGLTPFGLAQAEAAAAVLAREPVDALYVSPLRRAQETAAPLAKAAGIVPVTVDALAEIGVEAGGMTQSEVDRFFVESMRRPLHQFWDGFPSGESFRAFHARVTGGVEEVLANHAIRPERAGDFTVWHLPARRQTIVVVAHGGTNAVLLTHLLDVRPLPWEWIRFELELGAFAVVKARAIGDRGCVWSLVNFNEIDPLRAAGLR